MMKIVTANLLTTGAVVFLAQDGSWTRTIAAARSFVDDEAARDGLATAQRDARNAPIVDPFITDATPNAAGDLGMTMRDRIRAFGPTIKFLPADTKPA